MNWLAFIVQSLHFRLIVILFSLQIGTLFTLLLVNDYFTDNSLFAREEVLSIASDYLRDQALSVCANEDSDTLASPTWQDLIKNNPNIQYYYKKADCEFNNVSPHFKGEKELKAITEAYNCTILDGYLDETEPLQYLYFDSCSNQFTEHMELGGLSEEYELPFGARINNIDKAVVDPNMVFKSYLVILGVLPFVILLCLRPMRKTASLVSGISVHSKTKHLPTDGVFSEAAGLIKAFNLALRRLDEGRRREISLRHTIAHELKTPLTRLRNDLELIEKKDIKDTLVDDVVKMNELIERILKFARVANLQDSSLQVDLVKEVRAACAEALNTALMHNMNIKFESHCKTPFMTSTNKEVIFFIIVNIINNAVLHSKTQQDIEVSLFPSGEVRVRDNGVGLPEAVMNKLNGKLSKDQAGQEQTNLSVNGFGVEMIKELVDTADIELVASNHTAGGASISVTFSQALAPNAV